ncbi:MAG: DUF302 domain-containing protein [Gammaproteobacteria bacterium]|jgi:uncharacterized protein (DUF302 family)
MKLLWNLLAVIGLAAVSLLVVAIVKIGPSSIANLAQFDPQAASTYAEIGRQLLATGNGAEATVWKVPVQEGLTAEDVEQTMRVVANEHNIKNVGELPLYKEIEAISGHPSPYIKLYMFCNPMTAAHMFAFSEAFSAYLPCRISLVEDPQGKLWLYTLNMDMMIYGGKPLPPELKQEAIQVKDIILDIMHRGASGDF